MATKGYKTTEFWIASLSSVAVILNQSGILGSFVLPVEAIATVAGVIGSYIISRGIAKLNA